ncbi:MAG: aminotransferase [Acidimicrobiales bacterium]
MRRTTQLEISPIAAAHAVLAERSGTRPLLDLSQAAPAYPPAALVQQRIAAAATEPDTARYAPSPGLPELRTAFAADINAAYQTSITPAQTLITAGCNQAFCVTASAIAAPGDEMIVPVPYYFNHDMWLKLDGIKPVYLQTDEHMQPDPEAAARLITNKTRAILLVSPGNPTGAILSPDTIRAFFDLAVERDLVLILDETYRTFRGTDQAAHRLYDEPNWSDTLITLHSFSKDLAIPGYRVGAIVASEALIAESLKLFDCVAICAPRIGQLAAIAGLREAPTWRVEQADRIGRSLETFRTVMAEQPGGFRLASSGAFFGWVQHPFADLPVADVVRRLVVDADVLTIPGTAFTPTDERWLRFSFANLDGEQLIELGRRLAAFSA